MISVVTTRDGQQTYPQCRCGKSAWSAQSPGAQSRASEEEGSEEGKGKEARSRWCPAQREQSGWWSGPEGKPPWEPQPGQGLSEC